MIGGTSRPSSIFQFAFPVRLGVMPIHSPHLSRPQGNSFPGRASALPLRKHPPTPPPPPTLPLPAHIKISPLGPQKEEKRKAEPESSQQVPTLPPCWGTRARLRRAEAPPPPRPLSAAHACSAAGGRSQARRGRVSGAGREAVPRLRGGRGAGRLTRRR